MILGAVHSLGLILMVPPPPPPSLPPSLETQIVFHVIPVNLAGGKGISFPCAFSPLSPHASHSIASLLLSDLQPQRKEGEMNSNGKIDCAHY